MEKWYFTLYGDGEVQEPTPIEKVCQIAGYVKKKFKYVYTGNC